MNLLVYALPGNDELAELMAMRGHWERRALAVHEFPDKEALVTVAEPDPGAEVLLVCTLDDPNPKLLPLLMAAATLRELGAARITLVAPYLAYMRQDRRFHKGEAISSEIFGALLARYMDAVVTVDPHLHRHARLQDTGLRNALAVAAAPAVAAWIRTHVPQPLIVGPDEESQPWVTQVGRLVPAPTLVARKMRRDDAHVSITFPTMKKAWIQRTPVVLDDIASTGQTMRECIVQLAAASLPPPICVAVHSVNDAEARRQVCDAGARRLVSTNSIPGHHADIDISGCIVDAILARDAMNMSAGHRSGRK